MTDPTAPFSFVLQTPAASPDQARAHFGSKLAVETDPSDVHADVSRKKPGFVVVDARPGGAWAEKRVPGAVSLPLASVSEKAVETLRGRGVVVVYCWGSSCNAATKAAAKLSALGFQVKEMIGGLDAWVREGYPTEGTLDPAVPFDDYLRDHHRPRP